jgi:hypothetical protein
MRTEPRPVAPRQRLSVVDPTLVTAAGAVLGIGIAAGGNLLSNWVWNKYVAPKRKTKTKRVSVGSTVVERHLGFQIDVETIEERVIRTRKIRLSIRGKL